MLRKKQSKVQLAQCFHAIRLSLHPCTLIKAIKNNQFISWLGLTTELFAKYLPKSIATFQGNANSDRQGLQSTKLHSIDI